MSKTDMYPRGEGPGLGPVETLLGQEATWAMPPATVESAILFEITGHPAELEARREFRPKSRWPVVAALGAAAAAVVLFLGLSLPGDQGAPETVVALQGTGLASTLEGTATVRITEVGWYVRLDLAGLPPAPEGTYYEGWVVSDSNAVSIGTFHMRGGNEPVVLWSGVSLFDYPELEVTLQEEGGGFAPSGEVVLTGRMERSAFGEEDPG